MSLLPQADDTVYLLDYTGPPGFAVSIAQRVARCVVLDHHKTAAEALAAAAPLPPNLDASHLDMNRSGAMIALDYFKPTGLSPQNLAFFHHIQDGDLWRWALPGSREFYGGLSSLALNFDVRSNPGIFDQILALDPADLIEKGRVELKQQGELIAAAVDRSFVIDLGGERGRETGWGQALAVEAEGELALKHRSGLGNALAAAAAERGLRAVGAVVYREEAMAGGDTLKISLRSTGDEDTTVVSQAFGGGGHLNASSFLLPERDFATWKA